jgi:hypothetical protein
MNREQDDSNNNIITLDSDHTVSEGQAVMLMLGYTAPFIHDPEGESFEYTLSDYLYDLQDAADRDYGNALYAQHELKQQPSTTDEELRTAADTVESTKNALLEAQNVVSIAKSYLQLIKNEVVKARIGQKSDLVIDPQASVEHGCAHITKFSLQQWLANPDVEKLIKDRQAQLSKVPTLSSASHLLSPTKQANLLATLGLFTLAVAETSPKFKHGSKPNVSAIANQLEKLGRVANNDHRPEGLSAEAIKGRIEEALKALDKKLPVGRQT